MNIQKPAQIILLYFKIVAVIVTLIWITLVIISRTFHRFFDENAQRRVIYWTNFFSTASLWFIAVCIIGVCLMSMHRTYTMASPRYILKQFRLEPSQRDMHETDNMTSGIAFWAHGFIIVLTIMSVSLVMRKPSPPSDLKRELIVRAVELN